MFKYYNPNPEYRGTKNWTIGDCAVRCICKATGQSWNQVYKRLCDYGCSMHRMPNDPVVMDEYLRALYFVKRTYKRGTKRQTVEQLCKEKGTFIVALAGHYTCVSEGNYYDTWECGKKTAYFYWEKVK